MNNGYGMPFGARQSQYGQQKIKPKFRNPLTAEERAALTKTRDAFNLKVTDEEMGVAVCTHKIDGTSQYDVDPLGDGRVICRTCKTIMDPDAVVNEERVQAAVDEVLNYLQCAKLIDSGLNAEIIRNYFPMIAYIKKLPQLIRILFAEYKKIYFSQDPTLVRQPGNNIWSMYDAISNPNVPVGGGYNYDYMAQQQQTMFGGSPFYDMGQQQPSQFDPRRRPPVGGYWNPAYDAGMAQQQTPTSYWDPAYQNAQQMEAQQQLLNGPTVPGGDPATPPPNVQGNNNQAASQQKDGNVTIKKTAQL